MFNLVIVGILFVFFKKIYHFFDAVKEKLLFNYKTKVFDEFIKRQNANVYEDLKIELVADREGNWLEFVLKDDEQMFEQMIAQRRQEIFRNNETLAIEEMKKILQDYTREREEE